MYQSANDLREERRRRQLYLVFGTAVVIAVAICAVLGFTMLTPGVALVRLGPENRFGSAADRPVDVAVRQLETSKLIPNRPTLSEDVVFVVRQTDGYRAFLGTDPSSGCFLAWRTEEQVYVDACGQHSYGFTGRNTNQLTTTSSRPVNMVELPVVVQDGVLFVEDRILHRDIR
jgi:hypothetical protein